MSEPLLSALRDSDALQGVIARGNWESFFKHYPTGLERACETYNEEFGRQIMAARRRRKNQSAAWCWVFGTKPRAGKSAACSLFVGGARIMKRVDIVQSEAIRFPTKSGSLPASFFTSVDSQCADLGLRQDSGMRYVHVNIPNSDALFVATSSEGVNAYQKAAPAIIVLYRMIMSAISAPSRHCVTLASITYKNRITSDLFAAVQHAYSDIKFYEGTYPESEDHGAVKAECLIFSGVTWCQWEKTRARAMAKKKKRGCE